MPYVWTRRKSLTGLAATGGLFAASCMRAPEPRVHGKRPPPPSPDEARVLQSLASHATTDGDGATLRRVFPGPQLRNLDPFVLLDDFNVGPPAGFPRHPHRGFEAFTYMISGAFEHRDSMGNESRVAAGGTQRFNSGRGAYHSEMPGTPQGNRGMQLWVNLPRRQKKMAPEYQETQPEAIPEQVADGLRTRTIVGQASPVSFQTDVTYLDVELLADARFGREIDGGRNTLLYVVEGEVQVSGQAVSRGHGVLLSQGQLSVRGSKGARFIFLSGRPHGEPIVHRGPFVD